MTSASSSKAESQSIKTLALALLLVSPLMILAFAMVLPQSGDFQDAFWPAARLPFDPYQVPAFLNPPWVALILAPLRLLSFKYALAVNAFLNCAITILVVARNGGRWKNILLTLTSAPFLILMSNGNIEWLPMLAFIIPSGWGMAFLLSKPQTGILAALIWFKQSRRRFLLLIPPAALIVVSFLVWGWWPGQMLFHTSYNGGSVSVGPWNFSPWPWLVPVGLILLYQAWKREDELLAVASTLCLTPYLAIYSLTLYMALLAARKPRLAWIAWIILWCFAIGSRWLYWSLYLK
jgi:hypothetical protein